MNSELHRAPLAVTSTGDVLINAEQLITDGTMTEVLAIARAQPLAIFIGIPLQHPEIRQILHRLEHGCHEAVALVIGARRKRDRRGSR